MRRLLPQFPIPLLVFGFLVCGTLPSTLAAEATGTITGTVADAATAYPVEGARIELPELGRIVVSQDAGRFIIADVPAGTHEIRVEMLGHEALSQTVTVTEGGIVFVELRLEPEVLHLHELVVTGTAFEESPVELPYAVTVTGRRTLAELGSPQAFDLFRNLTASQGILGARQGWYSTRPPGLVSETVATVNLRGLGASRTLVLLNGRRQVYIPIRLAGGRFVDVNAFPSIALDRVEVVKEGLRRLGGRLRGPAVRGIRGPPGAGRNLSLQLRAF